MIDARGLACPQPVILVKKAVEKDRPARVEVWADDPCAAENIHRFAYHAGYDFALEQKDDHDEIVLELKK
ncbi:MAG: sulfurtransferase TusA family protein [Eubacteriales bacterium]